MQVLYTLVHQFYGIPAFDPLYMNKTGHMIHDTRASHFSNTVFKHWEGPLEANTHSIMLMQAIT